MSLSHTVATGLISVTGVPGVFMIASRLAPAAVPGELKANFPKYTELWSSILGVQLSTETFIPFVGVCKVVGVASMWGIFGKTADTVCTWLYVVLCACAAYTNVKLKDPVAPAVIVGSLCLYRLL